MHEELRTLLLSHVSYPIAWGAVPRGNALPAICLHVIDSAPDYTMSGASGLTRYRVQFDCWGTTYASAEAVARAVKSAISGFRDGVHFKGIFLDSERDMTDDATDAEDELFRVSLDFQIWHAE